MTPPKRRSASALKLPIYVCLLAGWLIVSGRNCPLQADNGHWLTGYYATYNYSVMSTSQVDYTKLNRIIYWPVIPNTVTPGTLDTTPFGLSASTFSAGATDLVTRAHAAGAKALIGIGGDKSSGGGDGDAGATAGFEISTNPTYQATFINNIVSLMQEYGFDGVDINWEQITDSDNTDFTTFIQNLRTKLNTITPRPLLTMAPETQQNGGRPDLIAPIYQDFDEINIQTYVMSGPYCGWETWYNSPLNNGGATFSSVPTEQLPSVTSAFTAYTNLGIPMSMLGMGIQFDSAVWTGGSGTSTGGVTMPKQSWTYSASCGANPDPGAPNWSTLPYRQMITTLATEPGFETNFDSVADQSWLSYDPSGTGTTNESKDSFVSFDSPTSIAKKGVDLSPAQPGVGGSLGGVFIFELSGDYAATAAANSQHPLLNAANSMQVLLPGLITNLAATPNPGAATLTWTAANGATGYNVYNEASSGSGAGSLVTSVTTTTASIPGLASGTHWYIVEGVDSFGTGVGAQVSVTVGGTVNPTVTWATPSPISYGTALSATQLDATASVAGAFVYTPAAGAIPAVGTDTLSVTFTPTSSSYSTVVKTVSLVVKPAAVGASGNFGNVNLASSAQATVTFNFSTATTVSSIAVLTLGASGLDFKNAGTGTCTDTSYGSGASCTVNVAFTPTAAGQRLGAVVLTGSAGTPVATAYINGVGTGSQIAFDPGAQSMIGFPFELLPTGVAVDGAGNMYISDYDNKRILKQPPYGPYSIYVNSLSAAPYGLTVDGAGNLYIATGDTVLKVTPSGAQSTVGTGLIYPKCSAVDGDGNVYITNNYGDDVVRVTPAGVQTTFLSGKVLGTALSYPTGIAVDGSGNVYVADSGNNRILKVTSAGVASLLLGTGLSSPYGLAIGDTGNLFIADEDNNRILRLSQTGVQTVMLGNTTVQGPIALAVDSSEDLFVCNGEGILKVNRNISQAPALQFATSTVGSPSSDSPKTVTINNIGNSSLIFPNPSTGDNASISKNYQLTAGTTCPVLTSTSHVGTVASGSSCNYDINFTPTVPNLCPGTLTLTDNALNVTDAKQTLYLAGTGVTGTAATVKLTNLSQVYTGNPISPTATTTPTGLTVAFTYNGNATAPTQVGSYTVVATINQVGYSGSATGTLVISKATPTINWPAPGAITTGTALSATQLDAVASVPGAYVYSPAAGTVLAAGTDKLSVTFTPTDITDYNTATSSVDITVSGTASPRIAWIPDYYGQQLEVLVGSSATPTVVTVNLPCSPNSVAINSSKAYIACQNPDEILVYNATTISSAAAGTLTISPTQTITSDQFSLLIGITFDASNNLWVASEGNSQVDSITAAELATPTPTVTASLINSPGSPTGLAFDTDGSLWITGQYGGGILVNIPSSQLQEGSNATPRYCISSENLGAGCQYVSDLFTEPEGVAVFNGSVWVSNNSTGAEGNVPGRELVNLTEANGTTLDYSVFGNSAVPADSPFECPGGLFPTPAHLWINDESYGEANPECGAAGDVASKTGGIFSFTPAQLSAQTTTIDQVLSFSNVTGRPGFGGLYVQND